MCKPKIRQAPPPAPPPAAPPPPSETATGFASAGVSTRANAPNVNAPRRGVDSLRVDLNVPAPRGGRGVNVP